MAATAATNPIPVDDDALTVCAPSACPRWRCSASQSSSCLAGGFRYTARSFQR